MNRLFALYFQVKNSVLLNEKITMIMKKLLKTFTTNWKNIYK